MIDKVLYEKKGEIAYITLNRPEVKNAIDLDVQRRLHEIWTDFRDDDAIRLAILTGSGDAFCAGADLKTHVPEWAEAGPSLARDMLPLGFAGGITRGLHRIYKPIIAACNGWVLGGGGMGLASAARLIEMFRHFDRANDAVLRDELMRLYTNFQVARYTNQRAAQNLKATGVPGPELSLGKLMLTANLTATAELVAKVLGPRLVADSGEWGTYAWSTFVCGTPGMRIAGGSDETLRNIVSERVLGLPKEPGIDTTSPFKDLPHS